MLAIWKLSHMDTRFYRHVGQFRAWQIFGYLLSFYAIFALARTSLFAYRTLPQWRGDAQLTWEAVHDQWPTEVTAEVNKGTLSLSPDTPISIAFPEEVAKRYSLPKNLLLINSQLNPGNEISTTEKQTLLLLGPDSLWIKRATGNFDHFSLGEIFGQDSFTVTQTVLQDNNELVSNSLKQVAYLLLPLAFGWFWIVRLAARLFFLVMMTWLAQPILWVFGWFMSYRKTYRLGLFLLPIAEEVSLLLALLYPDHSLFSFWFIWLLALLIVGWTNRRPLVLKIE